MTDLRANMLSDWIRLNSAEIGITVTDSTVLVPVSDDASFRRYFRLHGAEFDDSGRSLVFVDAPPAHEDNPSFIKVSEAMLAHGLNCPAVIAADLSEGFLAVTDLGDRPYLSEFKKHPDSVRPLYRSAISSLQSMLGVICELPHYDEQRLLSEMYLFDEWFLTSQLDLQISPALRKMLDLAYDRLVHNALQQPQRFVHRDYHARNLMLMEMTNSDAPGILDFQDAVVGPISYDLVSLLKDCYYCLEREVVVDLVDQFRVRLLEMNIIDDQVNFLKWFDLMGLQRHLKCAGIFSRLNIRDSKPDYLADIPLVVRYLVEATALYIEFDQLNDWLKSEIVPRLAQAQFQRELPQNATDQVDL